MKGPRIFLILSVLAVICIGFLRFYRLGTLPFGLTKDESYYGYDAYSIIETGRDLWGQKLPLFFKSTGEYKLNLTYLIAPAIKVFGLTETAVRFPSAIFGFATLLVLYATLRELYTSRWLSLLGTVVFALSPWSYGMSRLFYESNVGLFFIALGLYAVLSHRFSLAAVSLALSSYLYSPYRYIGIILLLLACWFFCRNWTRAVKPILIYLLALLPLIIFTPSGLSTKRLAQEWLLRQNDYAMVSNDMRGKCLVHLGSPRLAKLCYPFWNKPVLHLASIAKTAVRALSPEFLFLATDNEYIVPKTSGMYGSFLLPFYLLGLCFLFGFVRLGIAAESTRSFILWSTLASTLIISTPGILELYRYPVPMYLVFLIIAAGLAIFVRRLPRLTSPLRRILVLFFILLGIFQTSKYLLTYRLYSASLPLLFTSDAREIFTYLESKRDYQYIVDRKFHGPLTAAFFWQIDPAYFQEHIIWTDPDPWGFINAYQLGNIYSQRFSLEQLLCEKHKSPNIPLKAVVIDDPGKYALYASLKTYDYSGSLNLHAVFDIDELYPHVLKDFPADLCRL